MPQDPLVGIIFHRESHPGAKSIQELLDPLGGPKYFCDEHLPLSEALSKTWTEDAHLIQYVLHSSDEEYVFARVSKHSALAAQLAREGGEIRVNLICLDHDLPDHRAWSDPTEPLDWLASIPEGAPSPTVWYSTVHGSRLVYVLTDPVSHLRAEEISTWLFQQWTKALGSDLEGARACLDWTRLFRLPGATRPDYAGNFRNDPRYHFIDGGPLVDPEDIPRVDTAEARATIAEVRPYNGSMPDANECDEYLHVVNDKGRRKISNWYKDARKMLKGREVYSVIFEEAPLNVAEGWNNGVLAAIGQVVGMTARLEDASPEAIFALLREPLEQLSANDEEHKDWGKIGWSMVCRMWAQELAKIEGEQREREQTEMDASGIKEEILIQLRAARPEDVPGDKEAADQYLAQRLIASDGNRHYIMRADGTYNLQSVGDSMLIPMIRELGMQAVIPIDEYKGRTWQQRTSKAILNDHAIPVATVRCTSRDRISYVDGDPGNRILHIPIHRLNPRIEPARSEAVEEWLQALFGIAYESGIEWLSHALVVNKPICALNLFGASGSGKSLLVYGLAECFEYEKPNDSRVLDRFNSGLLNTPIVNCDEGMPRIKGLGTSIDEIFRTMVVGGSVPIEGKMREIIHADICPRIILTANSPKAARSLFGSIDITAEDARAISTRMLTVEARPEARALLSARGNTRYTSGWVAGESGSNYVLANHIYYLHMNRTPPKHGTNRLLVEGDSGSRSVVDYRLRSEASLQVFNAIARIIESGTAREGLHVVDGRVYVLATPINDYINNSGMAVKGLSLHKVSQILRLFSRDPVGPDMDVPITRPEGAAKRGRWVEVDLALMYEECLRYGTPSSRIEDLLSNQGDGMLALTEVKTLTKEGVAKE